MSTRSISPSRSPFPAGLARVRRDLERWRRRRNRPARIPDDLWALAVELAVEHGVAPIARALRLDYYSLKRRLEAASAADETPVPTFLEVVGATPAASADCVVEVEHASGTRMRVHLQGGPVADVTTLVRTFLGDTR